MQNRYLPSTSIVHHKVEFDLKLVIWMDMRKKINTQNGMPLIQLTGNSWKQKIELLPRAGGQGERNGELFLSK